jgi:hypothetical protein
LKAWLLFLCALLLGAQTRVRPEQIRNWSQVRFEAFRWLNVQNCDTAGNCTAQASPVPAGAGGMIARCQIQPAGLGFVFDFGIAGACSANAAGCVQYPGVLITIFNDSQVPGGAPPDSAIMSTFPPCSSPTAPNCQPQGVIITTP